MESKSKSTNFLSPKSRTVRNSGCLNNEYIWVLIFFLNSGNAWPAKPLFYHSTTVVACINFLSFGITDLIYLGRVRKTFNHKDLLNVDFLASYGTFPE